MSERSDRLDWQKIYRLALKGAGRLARTDPGTARRIRKVVNQCQGVAMHIEYWAGGEASIAIVGVEVWRGPEADIERIPRLNA